MEIDWLGLDSALITTARETAVKGRTTVRYTTSNFLLLCFCFNSTLLGPIWKDAKARADVERVHLEGGAGLQFFPDGRFPQFCSQSCHSDCERFHCTLQHTFICPKSPPTQFLLPRFYKIRPEVLPWYSSKSQPMNCQPFSSPVFSSLANAKFATSYDTLSLWNNFPPASSSKVCYVR